MRVDPNFDYQASLERKKIPVKNIFKNLKTWYGKPISKFEIDIEESYVKILTGGSPFDVYLDRTKDIQELFKQYFGNGKTENEESQNVKLFNIHSNLQSWIISGKDPIVYISESILYEYNNSSTLKKVISLDFEEKVEIINKLCDIDSDGFREDNADTQIDRIENLRIELKELLETFGYKLIIPEEKTFGDTWENRDPMELKISEI